MGISHSRSSRWSSNTIFPWEAPCVSFRKSGSRGCCGLWSAFHHAMQGEHSNPSASTITCTQDFGEIHRLVRAPVEMRWCPPLFFLLWDAVLFLVHTPPLNCTLPSPGTLHMQPSSATWIVSRHHPQNTGGDGDEIGWLARAHRLHSPAPCCKSPSPSREGPAYVMAASFRATVVVPRDGLFPILSG